MTLNKCLHLFTKRSKIKKNVLKKIDFDKNQLFSPRGFIITIVKKRVRFVGKRELYFDNL